MAVTELPHLLVSSLLKVQGEKLTSAPSAKGSSGSFKADVDGELLNKLTHPQLIALYQKFLIWEP